MIEVKGKRLFKNIFLITLRSGLNALLLAAVVASFLDVITIVIRNSIDKKPIVISDFYFLFVMLSFYIIVLSSIAIFLWLAWIKYKTIKIENFIYGNKLVQRKTCLLKNGKKETIVYKAIDKNNVDRIYLFYDYFIVTNLSTIFIFPYDDEIVEFLNIDLSEYKNTPQK